VDSAAVRYLRDSRRPEIPRAAVFEYCLSAAAPDPLRDAGSEKHSTATGRSHYLIGLKFCCATLAG